MTNHSAPVAEPILATRRVDPEKVERLREYFESLDDRRALFEKGLETENMHTEAAFLQQDDDVLELGEEHESVLDDVCVESARDEDGALDALETLFSASSLDREE